MQLITKAKQSMVVIGAVAVAALAVVVGHARMIAVAVVEADAVEPAHILAKIHVRGIALAVALVAVLA